MIRSLVFRVNVFTHYRVSAYWTASHQRHLAAGAYTSGFGFIATLRADKLDIFHQTTPRPLIAKAYTPIIENVKVSRHPKSVIEALVLIVIGQFIPEDIF